jgi:hypothetical protein
MRKYLNEQEFADLLWEAIWWAEEIPTCEVTEIPVS